MALDEKIHDIEVKGMHDRTKTMMEADKAQDEFNQTQRETARLLKINSIELMNVADAQMVYGKGFEDLAPKTQEQIDLQQTLVATGIEGFALLANTTVELWQQQLQKQANAEMKYINDKLQRGEIFDKEFERRRKAIARRQFEQQKEASMYQVIIAGAVASANVWAQYAGTPPIALALQALVVAETASQLALIANQPIPEFEKGGEIGGKRHRDGGTIIEAERGEFMVNRIAYANNKDVVNAINDGKFDKYIHEHYVLPSLKLGSIHSHDNKSLAENIAKSILLQSKLDDQRIVGHLKMNNDTSKDNTLALINALGKRSQRFKECLKIYLDDTPLTDEPDGWASFTKQITRSVESRTIIVSFPTDLVFYGDGWEFIYNKFGDDGYDVLIDFRAVNFDSGGNQNFRIVGVDNHDRCDVRHGAQNRDRPSQRKFVHVTDLEQQNQPRCNPRIVDKE